MIRRQQDLKKQQKYHNSILLGIKWKTSPLKETQKLTGSIFILASTIEKLIPKIRNVEKYTYRLSFI